jgi:Raf kinase inhibitor-like YbhB/YbcL family protein
VETEEEIGEEAMKIESPAFGPDETIPAKYTCDGENINPQLDISGIPADAVSIVLIVDDPDAPVGTWVHWTVWNIDPGTEEIAENSVPGSSVEGVTDFGVPGYGGPCPPSGKHRYFFKVYALDTTLDLDTNATAKDVEDAMQDHILDSAELIGLYGS